MLESIPSKCTSHDGCWLAVRPTERSHLPLIHLPTKPLGARRSKCPTSWEWSATMSCTFAHTVQPSPILGPRADMRARSEARRASPRARRVRHPSRCRLQIILANRAVEIDSLDDVIRDRSCILVDQNAGSGNSCGMHSREDVCCWQPAKTA